MSDKEDGGHWWKWHHTVITAATILSGAYIHSRQQDTEEYFTRKEAALLLPEVRKLADKTDKVVSDLAYVKAVVEALRDDRADRRDLHLRTFDTNKKIVSNLKSNNGG